MQSSFSKSGVLMTTKLHDTHILKVHLIYFQRSE